MRYIVQQRFVTTVSDQEVLTTSVVQTLLDHLCESSADVSFTYKDARSGSVVSYPKTRIRKVVDEKVNIIAFGKTGSVHLKDIPFVNIVQVSLVTDTYNIMVGDKKLSRYDLLDIDEQEADGVTEDKQ